MSLKELAIQEFENKLGSADLQFLQCMDDRETCIFDVNVNAEIRANLINWVIKQKKIIEDYSSIEVRNAEIDGILDLAYMRLDYRIVFENCKFSHILNISNAILYTLTLHDCCLPGLDAHGLHCSQDLVLTKTSFSGYVDLSDVRLGSNLLANEMKINIPCDQQTDGVVKEGVTEQGDEEMKRREGYVRKEAASLYGARIESSIRFCNVHCNERIRITNARIDGDLDLYRACFINDGHHENGLIATNCSIGEKLILTYVDASNPACRIALDYTRTRILQGDKAQNLWPQKSRISLEGLAFEAFVLQIRADDFRNLIEPAVVMEWLRRNGPLFHRQPWLQVAKSFYENGYDDEARSILVEKEKEQIKAEKYYLEQQIKSGKISGLNKRVKLRLKRVISFIITRIWSIVDYGYRPEKVFKYLFRFWLIGSIIAYCGYNAPDSDNKNTIFGDAIIASNPSVYTNPDKKINDPRSGHPSEYPRFNAMLYSLDTLFPVLDLKQESHWHPNTKLYNDSENRLHFYGLWLITLYFYVIHIPLGWILAGLFVTGITQRLRQPS